MVTLVDRHDVEVSTVSRERAHREGLLHRAVSVFVFDDDSHLLLQRRSLVKAGFAGKWANTCCTHPRPGETVVAAGERRLREEMGLRVTLEPIGRFVYQATDESSGYVEHELDHVLVGATVDTPEPDRDEADDFRWIGMEELRADISDHGYAPWLRHALDHFPRLGPPVR